MREIGVRELKNTLSQTLRAVARGQRVRVSVHGQPVADIVPVESVAMPERLQRLVAEGRVSAATRPRPRRAPRLSEGATSASALVLEERDTER